MRRCITIAAAVAGFAGLAAPSASAAAKSCGTAHGVGNGTTVTKVTTTSGTCSSARSVARKFARTRVAPDGYGCKERFTGTTKASVTCTRAGRKVKFNANWKGAMPLPPAQALPG